MLSRSPGSRATADRGQHKCHQQQNSEQLHTDLAGAWPRLCMKKASATITTEMARETADIATAEPFMAGTPQLANTPSQGDAKPVKRMVRAACTVTRKLI